MNEAPEEFEQLRRLLKLKRHEQPPPRFFNEFSGGVIRRLQSENAVASRSDAWWRKLPVLGRLVHVLETNTLATGGLATALCTMLLGGVVYSEYMDQSTAEAAPGGDSSLNFVLNRGSLGEPSPASTEAFMPATNAGSLFGSVASVGAFGGLGNISVQPISWSRTVSTLGIAPKPESRAVDGVLRPNGRP